MKDPKTEEKFRRWHLHQHELGACRCKAVVVPDAGRLAFEDEWQYRPVAGDAIRLPDATAEQAVAASAPEVSDVADGVSDEREAAPPAPPWWAPLGPTPYRQFQKTDEEWAQQLRQDRQSAWDEALNLRRNREQYSAAKLSYEEARARLEAEFGKEAVGQAVDGLTRLLAIRDDVDRLIVRAERLAERAASVRDDVCALRDKFDGEDG
jgi:hypothetical protein